MRSNRFFAAVSAAALAVAVPLAAAGPAAAITSEEAVETYGADGGYGGYSTGTVLFLNALNAETQELARISLAQSAAGAAVDEEFVDVDRLGSRILFEEAREGKSAYGHGAGLNVGLGGDPSNPEEPSGTLALVEALSPPPDDPEADVVVDVPADPLVSAQVLEADAAAFTTSADSLCDPASEDGLLLSEGEARAAGATALNPGETPEEALVQAPGESESISQMSLVGENPFGLTAVTTQTLADLTLLAGTPLVTTIEVLHDIQLRATATGEPGGADVFYGFVDANGDPVADTLPVVNVYIGEDAATAGEPQIQLTSQDLFGAEGFQLNLGVLDVSIGGPAEEVIEAPDGTKAFGEANFIRITAPGEELDPENIEPVFGEDSPFAGLNEALTPLVEGTEPLLTGLRDALVAIVGEGAVVDIAYGHLEALAVVPAGGIVCGECDPLADATKRVSDETVSPGQEFTYTINFTNECPSPLTGVVITDIFAEGLEYQGGSGTVTSEDGTSRDLDVPDTADGNTVRIEVGDVDTGDTVNIVLEFRAPSDAVAGQQFRNDADITGTFDGDEITKRVSVVGPTIVQPQLPRTGMETGAAALGILLLGGGALVARRRFASQA